MQSGQTREGAPIVFMVTNAPTNGPLPIKTGDELQGLFNSLDDQQATSVFLYLALGLGGDAARTFDDGMTRLEFVLVKCRYGVAQWTLGGFFFPALVFL